MVIRQTGSMCDGMDAFPLLPESGRRCDDRKTRLMIERSRMKRLWLAFPVAAMAAAAAIKTVSGAAALPACDPDNGGITWPPGFCATVIAEGISYARHIAIADNGDIYVGSRN